MKMDEKKSGMTIVSGMRPTGKLHLGHYFGVLHNWLDLYAQNNCYFFVADWHSLTTEYAEVEKISQYTSEMVLDWLSTGLDPEKATLFVQSHVPEHAELHLLLSMITPVGWLERVPSYKELQQELTTKDLSTYGFLGYPVLQTADIIIYKGDRVPVGQDQVAHVELTREIVRRFHHIYKKEIFPEPTPLLTKVPRLVGSDGRKMSKSYNNSVYLSDSVDETKKKFMAYITDPARQRRTDPGNPDVCPVFSFHTLLSPAETVSQVNSECRKAGIGCVDCKKLLLGHLEAKLAPIRDSRQKYASNKKLVRDIVEAGRQKASVVAKKTLDEVKQTMGLIRFEI